MKRLNTLMAQNQDGSHGAKINQIRKELNDLLDSEEMLWHQRSKIHWYKEGDKNTKNFHVKAMNRRMKNTIMRLWSEDGRWCDDKESISTTAVAYFQNIYTTTSLSCIEEITRAIPMRITREMNEKLIRPYTGEEVIKALHQIHPTKALGLDGMSTVFFS